MPRSMRHLLVGSCLALSTFAHMFISSPSPIAGTAPKDPLDASGSNFPCHGVDLPTSGGQTMKAGSQQTLAFDLGDGANTAVHGGGSCQLSVTYETDAAKQKDPANWKVIYSIEGGCPTDAEGNIPTAIACSPTSGPECVNEYKFDIPAGLKDGHVIMAWTWFNTIGNREMYMNCVNVEIAGGDGSEMDGLPSMFVANLASIDQCPTTENVNVAFPSPGKYATTDTSGPYPLETPSGAGCGAAAKVVLSSAPSPSAAQLTPTPKSSTSSPPKTAAPPVPTTTSAAPVASAPSLQQGSSSGKCPTGQTACPTPGEIICIDSTHFGICDIDNCAIAQDVAPGTTCSNGQIMRKRGWKRSLADHKRHMQHHHHGF